MPHPDITGFPPAATHVFKWRPVLFHPVQHSPERFVIGLIVISGDRCHLLSANQFSKFECFFGSIAVDAIFAAKVALDAIESRLRESGPHMLQSFQSPVSGVDLGEEREAEGESWNAVASRWFSAISPMFSQRSVYSQQSVANYSMATPMAAFDEFRVQSSGRDRLPTLVMDYILGQRPSFSNYFDRRLKTGNRRGPSYETTIGFSGSKLVANFGTLFANKRNAVDRIKRRMWDLNVERGKEAGELSFRAHEMIVQYPERVDPQVTERQFENINEALEALEREADTQEIRMRAMHTIDQIGKHILDLEVAA